MRPWEVSLARRQAKQIKKGRWARPMRKRRLVADTVNIIAQTAYRQHHEKIEELRDGKRNLPHWWTKEVSGRTFCWKDVHYDVINEGIELSDVNPQHQQISRYARTRWGD